MNNELGSTLTEIAILLSLVSILSIVAVYDLGTTTSNVYSNSTHELTTDLYEAEEALSTTGGGHGDPLNGGGGTMNT